MLFVKKKTAELNFTFLGHINNQRFTKKNIQELFLRLS